MRTSCLAAFVVLVVSGGLGCSALVAPDTTRLHDGEDAAVVPGMDSGPIVRPDATPGVDAWQMPGCPTPCTDGTVCDGTSCVCPFGSCCPACDPGQACVAADCVACGNPGDTCCDGAACNAGAVCLAGSCASCGNTGDPCCDGGACAGLNVCNGATCDACGGDGQPCCDGATCSGGTCSPTDGLCHGGTMMCGDQGQPCCVGGTCNDNALVCNGGFPLGGGTCDPCGGDAQPCCSGGTCDSGFMCSSFSGGGTCNPCGGAGQRCCTGGHCRDGRTCRSGFCN